MLDRFLDWLAALPSVAQYLVLGVLSALENVFPPVPADVAVGLGAFLAQRGETSAVLIGLVCWGANTASAAGMYLFARAHGEAFFAEGWPRRLMPPQTMTLLRRVYDRHGVLGIFMSRFLPGFRAGVTPFAGVVGMSPARALVPAALASGIWYSLIIAVGSALGLNWEAVKALLEGANKGLGLVSAVLLAAALLWLWRARRHGRTSG
jgi:membrane protein DedA with SNARE-associated domain